MALSVKPWHFWVAALNSDGGGGAGTTGGVDVPHLSISDCAGAAQPALTAEGVVLDRIRDTSVSMT